MLVDEGYPGNSPLVSVIMPTYNQAGFIAKAIDSVLRQTESNLELIIIDNFSDDGTKEVVLSHRDPRVQYFSFKNKGIIAASRNVAIRRARGKYIAFLDSDDYWDPEKLTQQLIYFRNDDVVAVSSRATLFGEKIYYRDQTNFDAKKEFFDIGYEELLNDNQVITSSVVVRAASLSKTQLFNENPDFICIEDWDLWLQLTKLGKIRILRQKLVHYFVSRKRGEAYSLVAENMTKLMARERDSGFLAEAYYREPVYSIFLTIARSYIEYDAKKSQKYYWSVLKGATNVNKKLKALVGFLLCCMPLGLRQKLLYGLYQIEHAFVWRKW